MRHIKTSTIIVGLTEHLETSHRLQ